MYITWLISSEYCFEILENQIRKSFTKTIRKFDNITTILLYKSKDNLINKYYYIGKNHYFINFLIFIITKYLVVIYDK